MQPRAVWIEVDGTPVEAERGRSLAAALLAAGIRRLRFSPRSGLPRGAFCMMGVCQECVVEINGSLGQACMTRVADKMVVRLGRPAP
jgi:predicted molibdopterin-dependent oxidoreductase YjgC